MARRSRRKSRQLSRADTRRQLRRAARAKPVRTTWCDDCQDAPATTSVWRCERCGFVAIAPVEVAAVDPNFGTCLNCDG